jgi:hypothetical protein
MLFLACPAGTTREQPGVSTPGPQGNAFRVPQGRLNLRANFNLPDGTRNRTFHKVKQG